MSNTIQENECPSCHGNNFSEEEWKEEGCVYDVVNLCNNCGWYL